MRTFYCTVRLADGSTCHVLAVCQGKEHIPALVDAIVFPQDATGIDDAHEIDLPAAYILADQS